MSRTCPTCGYAAASTLPATGASTIRRRRGAERPCRNSRRAVEPPIPGEIIMKARAGTGACCAGAAVHLLALILTSGPCVAQDADHPPGKTLMVGSDFGIAPWMVRGAAGPEGFGVDMVNDIARRLGRPGVEIVDI